MTLTRATHLKKIQENRYIVKFTKHSTAETIHKQRKKLRTEKEDKTNQIKFGVSLTMLRQKLLEYATKVTCDYSLNYFAYADINGNLKIRLKKLIKNRAVFSFINKTELAGLN